MAAALLLVTLGAGEEAERYTSLVHQIACSFIHAAMSLAVHELKGVNHWVLQYISLCNKSMILFFLRQCCRD